MPLKWLWRGVLKHSEEDVHIIIWLELCEEEVISAK
jgi:hypothetical protein